MTNADPHQIARSVRGCTTDEQYTDLIERITTAITEARTAGFNEAKGRAVEMLDRAADQENALFVGATKRGKTDRAEQFKAARDVWAAASAGVTALQAMTPGGSDD